ncbi:uncharacterized protein LOC107791134 [Nicotiana tabacum]|uniref:Uncharacterized protein LOC107791134 n=1 Tax=Nicotiana tabacum TaxID=4097 RepID=A0A1S3ZW22_TOBAC|nr:PREDICTED: uncharacterized protein LOC107791134 [Nicotiana tabacum]
MYNRLVPSRKGVTTEFLEGMEGFVEFALMQHDFVSNGSIRCPCSRCRNISGFLEPHDVRAHLYKHGFMPNYYQWESHGEPFIPISRPQPSRNTEKEIGPEITTENPYRTMVLDAIGHSFNFESDGFNLDGEEEQPPNRNAQEFFDMLKASEEPLFDGCVNHSTLSAVCRLLNIKSEFNMSDNCYNQILLFLKELLPEDAKLPNDYYRTKQMVAKLGLGYEKIDVCKTGCILYYKGNKDKVNCPKCGQPRYKPKRGGNGRQNDVAYKVLRYFPITTRLQRLYMSTKTAENMIWHWKSRREPGVMSHPSDGEAWKKFDQCHSGFAAEPRNIRLGLAADGFSPYGQMAHPYSCWPVIITPYNLPPEMCMSSPYMFLSLLIPGPKSPGKNIDLYLQPLIDELKQLWVDGVENYDSYKKQNFQMRAALMWTINDFPAYGMLSGWSTHGHLACPCCMRKKLGVSLKGWKKSFIF